MGKFYNIQKFFMGRRVFYLKRYKMDEESRFVRRCIERENNKFRKIEKKNFLDTMKKILDFIFKKGMFIKLKILDMKLMLNS
jgi:hypothetical protein